MANAQESIGAQGTQIPQTVPWIGLTKLVNVTEGIANVLGMKEPGIVNELANTYGVKEPNGLLVENVETGSPGEKAGVQGGDKVEYIETEQRPIKLGGDVIIKADNKTITNRTDLNLLLRHKNIGDNLQLTIFRDGQIKQINLTVGSKPGLVYEDASIYKNTTNVSFSLYENAELGMGLKYPSNWELDENEEEGIVFFRSLLENINDTAADYVKLSVFNAFPSDNMTYIANVTSALPNLKIIEPVHNITFANNSVAKTIYSYTETNPDIGDIKAIKIATQKNDKIYLISYLAQTKRFDIYLPTIEEMINSFSIVDTLEYEDFTVGMKMKYPSNWNVSTYQNYSDATFKGGHNVTFFPSVENNSSMFTEHLEIFVSDPDEDLPTVRQDFNDTVEYYETLDYPNFRLIESNSSHLENINPSYNVTYSYGDPDFGIIIETHIITIQNDRLYSISSSLEQKEYPNRVSTINKMIKSIEFFEPIRYADHHLGLILQYPSDLKIQTSDENISFCLAVSFLGVICDAELEINVYDEKDSPNRETSYDIYKDKVMSKTYLNTTLGKLLPADKMVFKYQDYDNNIQQVMQVNTTLRNRVYDFTYSAEPDQYGQYILTAEKIINSTKIIDTLPVTKVDFNNPEKSNFTAYNFATYGFSIVYPLDWEHRDYGKGLVEFTPVEPNENTTLKESSLVSVMIGVSPSENQKLYELVESDIGNIAQQNKDMKIIDSNTTYHGNNPAHRIVYTSDNSMTMNKYILNENSTNIYFISYNADIDEFYNFLPTIEQMIDSFKFNKFIKPRSYTGFKVGDAPLGMAVNTYTNRAYIVNQLSSTLSVVNGSNDRILTNIPVDGEPIAVAVNQIKNTIYVTHGGGSISVIDGKNNSRMTSIRTDAEEPLSIAVNPLTDRIYVADGESKKISVIDGSTNKEIVDIATGKSKEAFDPLKHTGIGVAVDQLRDRIYVANPSTNNVTVIDGADNRIISNISTSTGNIFDIAINPFTNIAYIVGSKDLVELDLRTNTVEVLGEGLSFNTVAINPFRNIVYVPDMAANALYAVDPISKDRKEITVDSRPAVVSINPNTNIIYVTNTVSDTVTKVDGIKNEVLFGIGFDIKDGPREYEIFGFKFPVNASKEVNVFCNVFRNKINISDNDYINFNNATSVKCEAHPKNIFSPILKTSWSGFDHNPSNEFDVTKYGVLTGTFFDLSNVLQALGLAISTVVLVSIVFAASIPSILGRRRKVQGLRQVDDTGKQEVLSKTEVIAIDASVIVGVLFFLTISEGFAISEQTHITIVTANIVFPFAISAVLEVINREKFAMRLMIAGFINLMVSVILIAIMRL